jgi:hypothetical protein
MSGKGDKRRPGKQGAYEEGYEAINWKKNFKKDMEALKDCNMVEELLQKQDEEVLKILREKANLHL